MLALRVAPFYSLTAHSRTCCTLSLRRVSTSFLCSSSAVLSPCTWLGLGLGLGYGPSLGLGRSSGVLC